MAIKVVVILLLKILECYIHVFSYRIIRRRVIWLIGCWCGVKMSAKLRPTLYQTILPLLHENEDLVVRIEAAMTLRSDILF